MIETIDNASLVPKKQSSFTSDVIKLVGGTAFAQALAVLASPVLTRIYGPEAFGIAALFTAVTGIISVVACLRYEQAIMLPKREEEAANILGLSLLIAATIALFLVPVLWLGQEPLLRLLNAQGLAPHRWLVPLAVFLSGVFMALNYWNSRTKRFGRLSVARVNASISTTGTQIGLGLAGYNAGGTLIMAGILGSIVSTLVLGGQILRDDGKIFRENIHLELMKEELRRYRKFPIVDTWSELLNSISWQLPIFMLSAFFSPTVVGFYSIGTRVLQLPMSLVGGSISQVFFQRAAEANAEGTLSLLVENAFRVFATLGLFPLLMLTLIGKDLFVIFFGTSWAEAGVYAQILSIWTFFWFVSSPLSTVYYVLEKQEFALKLNLANFITRFLSIGIGGLLGDPRISIFLFAISGLLVYSYLLITILKFAGVPIVKAIDIIVRNLKIFSPIGIIIVALKVFSIDPMIQVAFAITLSVIYYAYLIKKDPMVSNFLSNHF